MRAAAEGRVRAAVMLGGNLWGSNPDHAWAGKALRSIDLTAQISTKLNPGHIHGRGKTTLVLPALARDEEWQATTQESMFNFVRLSDGGPPNVDGDMRSEVEIVADLAERVLPDGRFDWSQLRSHESLRRAIATVVPGYSPIADIGTTLTEFQIPGRSFHEPRFNTKDGRANFHIPPLPAMELAADELLVMTIRSEGQFNTVVYDEEDLYRGNERRDVIMLSQADAFRHGLSEGQTVGVRSEVGSMRVHVAVVDIAEGSAAMYYPEANVLVGQRIDPRSKTPAFKSVRVRLEAG
jgi:anaerobic selenocysteine-containing dehydrogenase